MYTLHSRWINLNNILLIIFTTRTAPNTINILLLGKQFPHVRYGKQRMDGRKDERKDERRHLNRRTNILFYNYLFSIPQQI